MRGDPGCGSQLVKSVPAPRRSSSTTTGGRLGGSAGQTVSVRTVNGKTLTVDGRNGVKVNDAMVTQADIAASNGIIHVVDAVILPPES